MEVVHGKPPSSEGKVWNLCKMPFWQPGNSSSSSSNTTTSSSLTSQNRQQHNQNQQQIDQGTHSMNTVSSVARSLLPTRRRLRLDPANKLYFPYEPGKQVRSAIRIKNTSKSHAAFKFQTNAPKSCFMRPPGGILAPGESIVVTVFKFVEHPEEEKQTEQKCKVKFKIVSLKVAEGMEYVPELYESLDFLLSQFDEQKDHVAVEQILRVVFLDIEKTSPAMEKLKRQLAEAEEAVETRKKPPEDTGPRIVGEGLVIDEWKERRERYLARQQVEGVDSV
ncbi:hypothetical protein C5167_019183 [Papaver somniferum]|uniref:MSP domain-containing protein n=1 Tax=Papaver somniferum TaxID=3469 RepID=A0A4Y7IPG2_PAPSO|nr:hypothetical protein C5167_019183 [Papaver somniferum]